MARPTTKVRKVEVKGPLAPFAVTYRSRLRETGYTPLTIAHQLGQVARLSRWMQTTKVTAHELTTTHVEQFLALRRAGRGHRACFQKLLSLLAVLFERAVSNEGPVPAPPESGREVTLAKFHRYLLAERALAVCTARAYVDRARRFLDGYADDRDLGDLNAGDVTRAVQREVARVSIGSAQYFVAGLRSFLRFCFVEGLVGTDLAAAALAVTGRRRSPLPKGISGLDTAALLDSCDRRRSDGRRDLAVLLLLLRLGLRAGEVAGLTLDDIDWRAGEIVVRGKGRREDRLPLPVDVGESIACYLQRGRPKTSRQELFLRSLAPIGPLCRGGVSSIVRHACLRAGVAPVGAHRLRHTLACALVAADAGLGEIGELLRHRSVTSTAIYARVDIETLRTLAQPWPGGEQR